MALTSQQAETIAKRALEVAKINKLNPMAVCVLNAAGQTLFFKMEDGNPLFREAIARGKAMGAIGLGVDTAAMVKVGIIYGDILTAITNIFIHRCTTTDPTSFSRSLMSPKVPLSLLQEVS